MHLHGAAAAPGLLPLARHKLNACSCVMQFSSGSVDFHFRQSKLKFMQANHIHFTGTDSTLVGAVFFL